MRFERELTTEAEGRYGEIEFVRATSEIRNPDGSVIFRLADIEVPKPWSQVACDILAQKYFRKAGIPAALKPVDEPGVPAWLRRHVPDRVALDALPPAERTVGETTAQQVFDRMAGTWTYWGWKGGYFESEADARAFRDELCFMLARQMVAPNSPQWFNTGLHWAYGIDGPAQGHFYVDPAAGRVVESTSAYEHPQPHACFIQSVSDDLVNEGGIMDLWVREARLFKYGSGTGSNFSKLRGDGERLSGGGRSSGLMSFLKIGDRAAGAIKSGGTTRRAAKMVSVDVDHPDIEAYVDWKVIEEQKVAALVAGSKMTKRHLDAVIAACREAAPDLGDGAYDVKRNAGLKAAARRARDCAIPENYVRRAIDAAKNGAESFDFRTYDTDWDSEAYLTVAGQNSNNSVRLTNDFVQRVLDDGAWDLIRRTDGRVHKTMPARALWDKIGAAAWASADPGVQYDTTINEWHTCPAGGRINASNPCSEYMFLDDTACNLASLNLLAFRREDGHFDTALFTHCTRIWTVVLEISVLMAQFPSREIARLSYDYRTLGLGYANLGGLLMAAGLPYDSDGGRAIAAGISAVMTGVAYRTSAEMAAQLGPFPGFAANRDSMLRVIRNHRRAALGGTEPYEELTVAPVPFIRPDCPDAGLAGAVADVWNEALAMGEAHGYRNAQVSVVAPTGTIGLVMDCDTTGIEPDFALVKFKKLAGGGYFKIINRIVPEALKTLGYDPAQVDRIIRYAVGHGTLVGSPGVSHQALLAKGFGAADITKVEGTLASAFDIKFVFNKWTLGEELLTGALGFTSAQIESPGFDLLTALGFTRAQIEAANTFVCGAMTLEGAPAIDPAHLPVFDCANPCGRIGGAVPLRRKPHPHDGGVAALHLGRDFEDHQHAEFGVGGGLQGSLSAVLAAGAEGQCALSRRLQAQPAAVVPADRGRRGGGGAGGAAGHPPGGCDGRADRGARDPSRRAPAPAGSPQGLYAEGVGRRTQGLSADGRIRRRQPGRGVHRHAQGGLGLPLPDEQFRHRDLDWAAIWRAAGGIRRGLHLHALRARRDGAGERGHPHGDLDHRLHLSRTGDFLSGAERPGACRSG